MNTLKPTKTADERAAEFMAGIRARVAALDAVQASKCHVTVTNPISTIQPLPPARPAWLLAPGQRPRKRLYTGLILMPGQMVITL